MASGRPLLLIALGAAALLAGCGRERQPGPVRTPLEASEIAQRALRSAHLDEQVVSAERSGDAWVVTTRWPETSLAGHLVTVDAASGATRVERYRTIQLEPRPGRP